MKRCCTGNCQQGRTCPARRLIRWPMLCTRCGSVDHFVEDCKRMPAYMGLSGQERAVICETRESRRAAMLLLVVFSAALMLFDVLERLP